MTRDDVDRQLHSERVRGRGAARAKVTYSARADTLPNGTFVQSSGGPAPLILWDDAAYPWSLTGYGAAVPRPKGPTDVLTPHTTVAVLTAGYGPTAAL